MPLFQPYIRPPLKAWLRIDKAGACVGEYETRGDAREAARLSIATARIAKGQIVEWLGQPMRVKGGPAITRVRDVRGGATVYRVGRGRGLDVLITEVTPYFRAPLSRVRFRGVVWPLGWSR